MTRAVGWRATAASAGLLAAAVLWSFTSGGGDLLSHAQCHSRTPLAGIAAAVALVLSLVAGWYSWRANARWRGRPERPRSDARRSLVLLAGIGAGAALLFGFAIGLQALAGFLLSGCQR